MTQIKNFLAKFCLSLLILTVSSSFASSSSLFSVNVSGSVLTITSTPANHTYPNAGIKINTSGYSLTNPGSECTPASNGYCLFSVSDTVPHEISLSGEAGTVSYTLCLNGTGALSCQNYQSTIATPPTVAYIVDNSSSSVYQCPLDDEGLFTGTCTATGSGFVAPYDIAINQTGTFAYISNITGSVSVCPVNEDHSFGSCQAVSISDGILIGVSLNADDTALYVTDASYNTVLRCPISLDGSLSSSCTDSAANGTFHSPEGIALNASDTKAYVVNNLDNTLSVCSVNPDGSFPNCQVTSDASFNSPQLLSLNSAGTQAYIANSANNTVSICPIQSNGLLGACTTATGFDMPMDVGLSDVATAYVVNRGDNSISQCPVNQNGSLGLCINAGDLGVQLNGPWAISLR